MDKQTFSTKRDVDDSWEINQQRLEKGRQLHDQAIQQMFIMAAGGLARSLKKGFGNSAKDHEFEYFYGEMPVKK